MQNRTFPFKPQNMFNWSDKYKLEPAFNCIYSLTINQIGLGSHSTDNNGKFILPACGKKKDVTIQT